jgi:hypothetical protein
MLGGSASFRAKQFVTEANKSTMVYEVKRVRAVWDPSLSIPGTDRRGGWRCPEGTRYGGQITDRFGRQCGWGLVRRIANMVSNVGESLEDRDDRRRARRGGKRRVGSPATPELDTPNLDLNENDSALAESLGEVIPTPEPPKARTVKPRRVTNIDTPEAVEPKPEPRPRRAPRRRPQGNLRPSEQRRMERELEQPGAPRTGLEEPSVEQVLTPEQASDAVPTEEFRPYVLRKYNEYARNVRKIREEGGDAGMLTRREWYALNKDNLRSAWKDIHGVDAPDSFEPPTPQPRRPRRRRQRAVEEAASTRSPSLRNDKEPVAVEPKPEPKKPSRPKKPSSVRPTGAQDRPRRPAPPTPPDWVSAGNGRWNVGNWLITASEDENGNFLRFVASTPDSRYAEGVDVNEVVMAMNSEDDLFNAPREVDWNNDLERQGIFQIDNYLNDEILGQRIVILNDQNNFPVAYGVQNDADFADFAQSVENNILQARQTREAIEKLLNDGKIRQQDKWTDKDGVEINVYDVLTMLQDVEDAWLYVQTSNAEMNTPEPDLGSDWENTGDLMWKRDGWELQFFRDAEGRVFRGEIYNSNRGVRFEGLYGGEQNSDGYKEFAKLLWNTFAIGNVALPPERVMPKMRKKGRFISPQEIDGLTREQRNFIQSGMVGDIGMGVGYQNAASNWRITLDQLIRNRELGMDVDGFAINSNANSAMGVKSLLERIEAFKEEMGLSDSDYFSNGNGGTISIGEIKKNLNDANDVLKETFDWIKENYYTEQRLSALFRFGAFVDSMNFADHTDKREALIRFLLLNGFKDFNNLINLYGEDSYYDAQRDYINALNEVSQGESHEVDVRRVVNALERLIQRNSIFASYELDLTEISERLGLPRDMDWDSLRDLDELLDLANKKFVSIKNDMEDLYSKMGNQNLSDEETRDLVADFLRLDSEKHFFLSMSINVRQKREPLDRIRRENQASFDRDAAIRDFFSDDSLYDIDGTNLNKLLTIVERTHELLKGARGEERNDEFDNPAAIVGRALRDLESVMQGLPEEEQYAKLRDFLTNSESSLDQSIKKLNDAIEKFKISPTRKNLSVLRSQAVETIRVKSNVEVQRQMLAELNKPHRLNMARIARLEQYVNDRATAYDAIASIINEIFEVDIARYTEGDLVVGSDITNAVVEKRRELREIFKSIKPSPREVERLREMGDEAERNAADARSILNSITEEIKNFSPSGNVDADKAAAQEIGVRLAEASRVVAINALQLEELRRERHSKEAEMATRQIPQNPVQVLFGGKFEDHVGGINTDNIEERINSVIGEISDRRVSKYITDIDEAYRLLDKFDDDEIIRFPNGDIKVEDAKKALVESSRVYQEVRNARRNDPSKAIFTPRISGREDLTDEQLKIDPITQMATSGSEVDIAKVKEAVGLISDQSVKRKLLGALQEAGLTGDLQKIQNIGTFVRTLENFMNDLNIDPDSVSREERDLILMKVDDFINEFAGLRADQLEDTMGIVQAKRQRMITNVAKMDDLKKQLADGDINISEFNTQMEQLTDDYMSDLLSVTDKEDRIAIFNWAQSEVPKMVERKIRGLEVNDESVLKPLSEAEIDAVDKKISSQIKKGIARRLEVLQNYINERYPSGGSLDPMRPWEEMTPEIWDSISLDEKKNYLVEAYSHKRIVGSNGIIYNAEATVSAPRDGSYFSIAVTFNEIDSNGRAIRQAGTSERTIYMADGYVDHKYMWLGRSSPIDKNAGIQTIYNQHAFMYLNQIGITNAHVGTADDGPYVWARIGFKQQFEISSNQMRNIEDLLDRYRAIGPVGLIGSDAEYRRVLAVYEMWKNGADVSHQDFIFAFDSSDKFRALRQKEWFKNNFGLGEGVLDFKDQFVTVNPGRAVQTIAEIQRIENERRPIDNGGN